MTGEGKELEGTAQFVFPRWKWRWKLCDCVSRNESFSPLCRLCDENSDYYGHGCHTARGKRSESAFAWISAFILSTCTRRLFKSFRFCNVTEQMRRNKTDSTMTPALPVQWCSSSEQCYQYHQAASQQAITCCLISLALQMSPNARAVMAAAEEIGQNYQIM